MIEPLYKINERIEIDSNDCKTFKLFNDRIEIAYPENRIFLNGPANLGPFYLVNLTAIKFESRSTLCMSFSGARDIRIRASKKILNEFIEKISKLLPERAIDRKDANLFLTRVEFQVGKKLFFGYLFGICLAILLGYVLNRMF